MPALEPYLIEPIFEQFEDLLPEHETDHPLGCHRSRVPERVVFEKLVQVLVFGCAYHRIADESCSESTLRRRDEWIELRVMERLRRICLEAYDRTIGLKLSEVTVDCCITKTPSHILYQLGQGNEQPFKHFVHLSSRARTGTRTIRAWQ